MDCLAIFREEHGVRHLGSVCLTRILLVLSKDSEARPVDLVPKLFERLEVEITDTPLQEVLDSIQQRLGVPLLLDHVALARGKIDPSQAQVSYAKPRTYYKRILDETTRQAGLKVEVRVDEAGESFLWVTTRLP